MSRKLSDLAQSFKPVAKEFVLSCKLSGIPLVIVDTLRTKEEHAANIKAKISWIKRSKHIDGKAIDVCPEALIRDKGWNPSSELWSKIGYIGESLGMRWGGRWKQRDLGHFEEAS